MGKYHLRSSHVSLIARTHVKYSIRGGAGLVFVFLSLLVGLMLAQIVIGPVEGLMEANREMGSDASTEQVVDEIVDKVGLPAVKRFTGASDDQAEYLVLEKPALISAFMVMLLFFLPFLVSLGAFNQTSGDIANRGLRYQLLRTERANIFLGRFLGTYLFSLIVVGFLMGVVLIYLVLKAKFYPAGDVVLWMLRGYLAMAIYALPWVALCAWISSAIDSPFGSLVISQLFIGFWPVLIFFGKSAHDAVGYGTYLMPWGYKYWLLHPNIGMFLAGIAVMVAFSGGFILLGLRHFQKRDL